MSKLHDSSIIVGEHEVPPVAADAPEAHSSMCTCRKLFASATQRFTATTPTQTRRPTFVPKTYLYLAYGSNLAAETFLGRRGIRPVSRINVSAPAFDLNFALPGLAYWEPCFANVEPRRRIPQPPPLDPPKPPINPPKPPPLDPSPPRPPVKPPPPQIQSLLPSLPPKGPTWSKGLYGVVYEVTAEDYATIVRTEGGGASYKDVQTACFPLPPAMRVPEHPPVPELPRPFLAHTLYAPRLPLPSGGDDSEDSFDDDDNDDHDDDKKKWKGKLGKWLRKFLLPVQRPESDYAQPSLRYLTLIRDGARENYLPDDYQEYLAALQDYATTSRRQTVGKFLYALLWFPLLALVMALSRLLADRQTGQVPRWMAMAMTVLINAMWASYDCMFKKSFGDGERTQQADDDDGNNGQEWSLWSGYGKRNRRLSIMSHGGLVQDEEKNRLLNDW